MARTAIVTSQPEVACEICARRLLRGEHPSVFLADGEMHEVCELCVPRALNAGWVRTSELMTAPAKVDPGQRRRTLLERLRRRRLSERPGVEEPAPQSFR